MTYFRWYNYEHHHGGLAGFTAEQIFTGRYLELAELKQQALDTKYDEHPERFVRGCPSVAMPPESVAINPVNLEEHNEKYNGKVNFPTLRAAGFVAANSKLNRWRWSAGRRS